MLSELGKGLLGRLLSYGILALGFWFLFQAFERNNIGLGLLGGLMIVGGMYLMVVSRKNKPSRSGLDSSITKEDGSGDSLDGCGQGNKFSP